MSKRNKGKRRRNNKAVETKNNEDTIIFNKDMKSIIKVAVGVLVVFLLFSLLTFYITNKNTVKEDDTETTDSGFNYNSIVIGRSFSMKDEDYLVIYYDGSDEDISSTYSSLVSSYRAKDAYPIYYVNMGDALNKTKAAESGNSSATSIDELAIAGPTLIHFSNGKIIEYIDSEDSIKSYLG